MCPKVLVKECDVHFLREMCSKVHRSRVGPVRAGPCRAGPCRARGLLRALTKGARQHSKVRRSRPGPARTDPGRAHPRPQRQGPAHRAPAPGRSLRRAWTRHSQSGAGGCSPQRAGPAGAPGPLAGRGLLAAAAETSWRVETQPGRRSPCPRPRRGGPIGVRRRRRAGRDQSARAGGGGGDVVEGGDAARAALALPAAAAARTDWRAETPPGGQGASLLAPAAAAETSWRAEEDRDRDGNTCEPC